MRELPYLQRLVCYISFDIACSRTSACSSFDSYSLFRCKQKQMMCFLFTHAEVDHTTTKEAVSAVNDRQALIGLSKNSKKH